MPRCWVWTGWCWAAESDMLTAVEALERRISRKRSRVELKTIRTRYPMGAEKQIVQSVTRRRSRREVGRRTYAVWSSTSRQPLRWARH